MKINRHIIDVLIILFCIIFFVIIPVKYTIPVDYQSADNVHEAQTAFAVNVVNNWLVDGIVNNKFIMHADYDSVEFQNNHDRVIYTSYPPGSLVPLYVIAKVTGKNEISFGFVKRFVQFEYYLAILLIGLLFYICLRILEIKSRFMITAFPVIFSSVWAFLPFNLYYMNNVFFVDQAVILLSVMFFVVEISLYGKQFKKNETLLNIISCVVLFVGILTDYYFFCIVIVAIILRVFNAFQNHPGKSLFFKLFSETWPLLVSSILASALFIIQLANVPDGFKLLLITFLTRTANGEEFGGIDTLIYNFNIGFSVIFLPVLIFATLACLIFPFVRKKFIGRKQMILSWLSLIVFPAILHALILREHSIVHEFSMLKFNLVFVFIIFSVVFWLYINYVSNAIGRLRKYFYIAIIMVICLSPFYFIKHYSLLFYDQRTANEQKNQRSKDISVARFIGQNTNYYDVVYSPNYEIFWTNTPDLAIAKKRIYKISTPHEIPVTRLPDDAIINILIAEETLRSHIWNKYNANKFRFTKLDNFYLIKLSKESFRSVIN